MRAALAFLAKEWRRVRAWLTNLVRDKVAGHPSVVRVVALVLTLDASAVTATVCWVTLHGARSAEILALTSTLGALVASGVVALLTRAKATSTPEAPAADPSTLPTP
jgi:hypothetical protein